MRNALITQVFVVLVVAGIYAGLVGAASALGAVFGGCISITNGLLLFWRLNRGGKHPSGDPGRHLGSFFALAIERFVVVTVLFAMGMGVLKLVPLPLLLGFIAGQVALVMSGLRTRNK
ncbi:MAG: ATP synthase subunit I [Gammaproteobacteria bacterium]